MTRYWVSMPEAIWLVVQAAAIGAPGSVLMLDVTDEVPIVDDRAAGRGAGGAGGEPELPIRVTGLRPGERLREELLSEHEAFRPGPCPGLLEVVNQRRAANLDGVHDFLEHLRALAECGRRRGPEGRRDERRPRPPVAPTMAVSVRCGAQPYDQVRRSQVASGTLAPCKSVVGLDRSTSRRAG